MQLISEYFLMFCSITCLTSCFVLKKDLKKNEALLLISVGIVFLIIFAIRKFI